MSYVVTAADAAIVFSQPDYAKDVLQNVRDILATPEGSVPYFREFGIDMSFIDKPQPVARALLIATVTEKIQQFEPRAEVRSVTFSNDDSNLGRLIPAVEVEILNE
jgi:phage baseplate assembly protein W